MTRPGMAQRYDLVIIGSGTAAMTAAMEARGGGWRVAVVDFRPFGGTCALRGCDPKKMLIGGASGVDHVRRMRGKGIAGEVRIDWPALIAFKRGFTDPIPGQQERAYADAGIDAYHGRARFTGRNRLEVDGAVLQTRYTLIAIGAEPIKLGIPGEDYLIDNEGFLALEALPRRIVLVGGGYIAAEFSHIAARAGAQVTILQQGERILEHFDPDLVDWLMEAFQVLGIDVRTHATVEAVEKTEPGYRVHASARGQRIHVDAELVVHAAGRAPPLAALDLPAADIAMQDGKLQLNDYLQSVSNPSVYAAGDAAQRGPPLTPVASHDANVVMANLLEGNHRSPDYRAVPSVAFTIPPIASVGLGEAAARKQGRRFRVQSRKAPDWFTARQAAEPIYGFKVLIEDETELILGAHLVGPHVDEVINVFAFAMRHDLSARDLKTTLFAYPTGASDIGRMV
jgi:glutathione reductase (NADPH)